MEQFDIKRFGKLLKWWAITNKTALIKLVGGVFIFTFLAEALWMISVFYQENDTLALMMEQQFVSNIAGMMIAAFAFCVTFSGCYMSFGLNKKQSREAFLMVPATQLEKYMLRWLYVVIIIPVALFLSFVLADTLRMILMFILGPHEWISVLSHFFQSNMFIVENGHQVWMVPVLAFSLLLFFQSFYILGGILFRHHQFILTSVAGILLMVAFISFTSWLTRNMTIEMFDTYNGEFVVNASAYVATAISLLFAVLNYVLSFFFFKRMQIINNKWLNI